MREIKLKCMCGAEISLTDDRQVFINTGGVPDNKGRRCIIQVQADDWLDRHQSCYGISPALLEKKC